MAASALRDLTTIQHLKIQKEENILKEEHIKLQRKEIINEVMRFIIIQLKQAKNQRLSNDDLLHRVCQKHNVTKIDDLCKLKSKKLFKLMKKRGLINTEQTNGGAQQIIKLQNFDESELNDRINGKIKKLNWFQKCDDKNINKVIQFVIDTFKNQSIKELTTETLSNQIRNKFGKSLRKMFDIKKNIEFWNYLECKQIIKIRTTLDNKFSFISLQNDDNNDDDDNDDDQPPLKKRKVSQYVDDYNNGNIDQCKLTEKLFNKLSKLPTKHEIHFYFSFTSCS